MKPTGLAVAVALVAAFGVSAAQAQVSSTSNTTTSTTASTSASNEGVSLGNVFNSTVPNDVTSRVKYSGMYGTNASVGLAANSNSFSPDYCGGSASIAGSVPFVTLGGSMPVLGDPGMVCVPLRVFERTMQASAMFGSAAASAKNAGEVQLAREYAAMSMKLANGGINILCSVGQFVVDAYAEADVKCPPSAKEKAVLAKVEAEKKHEPTDNLVRARAKLPLLPEVQ
ncbi:hypothetical protein D3C87_279690 [compost metagenome]